MQKIIFIFTFLFLISSVSHAEQKNDFSGIRPHPRLLLAQEETSELSKATRKNKLLKLTYRYIEEQTDSLLDVPTLTYRKEGYRLLAVSREAMRRIFMLSLRYRLTGRKAYAQRAIDEMLEVSRFKDWNPSHFLDTGEMAMAVAIGYDWLFDELSGQEKQILRKALVEKAITPSFNPSYNWFLNSSINWNQVCNAGLLYAALAIYEDETELAGQIISRSLKSITLCHDTYLPDGNYPEGYNYWGYGTTFHVLLAAAMESAFGHTLSFNISRPFLNSAYYMNFMTGSSGKPFNYGDAREIPQAQPVLFWFAHQLKDPSVLWNEKNFLEKHGPNFTDEEKRFVPLIMVFGYKTPYESIRKPSRKTWSGQGVTPVAIIRTDWEYQKGLYFGIKGGSASTSHAHMDGGSFVFESDGIRWIKDLGLQEYHTLEKHNLNIWDTKQNSQRWQVFRYQNRAHSTLSINDAPHAVQGKVTIKGTYHSEEKYGVLLDLTPALGNGIKKAIRDGVIVDNSYLEINDTLESNDRDVLVTSTFVTSTRPCFVNDSTLELKYKNKKLTIRIEHADRMQIAISNNTSTNLFDADNQDSYRIILKFKLNALSKRAVKVQFIP